MTVRVIDKQFDAMKFFYEHDFSQAKMFQKKQKDK
jgi:hypothetical protein